MSKVKVRIDAAHSRKLLAGEAVSIKVPKNADVISLQLDMGSPQSPLRDIAKCMDVFFNGRKA